MTQRADSTQQKRNRILSIAVPSPVFKTFDYLLPSGISLALSPGIRVRVPFGSTQKIGLLMEMRSHSELPASKLKPIIAILDEKPCLPVDLLKLASWASDYYYTALGQVLHAMLPPLLRRGKVAAQIKERYWCVSESGEEYDLSLLRRAPKQQMVLQLLQKNIAGLTPEQLGNKIDHWQAPIKALQVKGLVSLLEQEAKPSVNKSIAMPVLNANAEQQHAITSITESLQAFKVWLLNGVTGSGKTEVYLQVINTVLAQGKQVLVLVPEIGLTPQLVERFTSRFSQNISVIHSAVTDTQRLNVWVAVKQNQAQIIIGTRSAIFMPLANPGLIIVDEEHDGSYKQQEGFRYHARDIAVMRAKLLNIPVVLGSATPSLESLHNAHRDQYSELKLLQRATNTALPAVSIVDARQTPFDQVLSSTLLQRMQEHLQHGRQVLLFLNRRGYAPVLFCHGCGWACRCSRCDSYMTLHQQAQRLRCHHCGADSAIPESCPTCGQQNLLPIGHGTERLEAFLKTYFADYKVLRIDRDVTRKKGQLQKSLQAVHDGSADILVGTQMLAKGHHFPRVSLVGIIGVDNGLLSTDFRGPEHVGQLITQVAGRAGREQSIGEVILESHQPESHLLRSLVATSYDQFAKVLLEERLTAQLPPYSKMVLFRAEAVKANLGLDFLQKLRDYFSHIKNNSEVELLGPAPAPMERRSGRFRAQLLLISPSRGPLHRLLANVDEAIVKIPNASRIRWSVDVDPMEMY